MILIIESGATKTQWVAVEPEGKGQVEVKTAGINLASMSGPVVEGIVNEAVEALQKGGLADKISEVHFYAAGLVTKAGEAVPDLASGLDKVFKCVFPDAGIEYASDLLAAARSVCGHAPGIAAILGTGSNSCSFDGEEIVRNIRPGGFILGDEGGGARLGKLFISDFIKGLVPEPLATEFAADFEVDYLSVVKNVYKGGAPAGYLGSFAPWIAARYDSSDYIKSMVDSNFRDFIERCLRQYDLGRLPVGVVGGFGYANRDVLRKVAEPYGIVFSTIISAPAEGLIDYHLGRK
ncbi:MAG: hypothetical protein IKW99_04085 [Bacteroidales bacterium]|nr:hypothetical protein [Bacteroidales bacterium]